MPSSDPVFAAASAAAPAPEAIVFGPLPGLFGWYHAPTQPAASCAVVICYPLHYEGLCTHRSHRKLALRLAGLGFAVLRFDYSGTGDSPGSDRDPARVRAWLDSVKTAAAEIRQRSGAAEIALVGVRTGGLLAAAAAPDSKASAVALWAPVSGRGYLREVTAFNSMRGKREVPAGAVAPAGEESAGFLITPETMTDLVQLELNSMAPPAKRVLLLERDDLPADNRLRETWAAAGAQVENGRPPGYRAMMVDPHLSRVPDEAWDEICNFLQRTFPAREERAPAGAAQTPPLQTARMQTRSPAGEVDVVEETLWFDGGRLFGIVSEPAAGAPAPQQRTCVLLPTIASHHRIGANRLHVLWAREMPALGYGTLRFDVSGTGDSGVNFTGVENAPYAEEQATDLQRAIDAMSARGYRRFVSVGICSGAYLVYHATLIEPRMGGSVLINPQTFHWRKGDLVQPPGSRMANFKSSRAYRRAVLQPRTWMRLLRGEVEAVAVLRELMRRVRKKVRWIRDRSTVLRDFQQLSDRGVETLLIFGADDVGIDYLESHLGKGGRAMQGRPNFQLELVEGTEHTFGQMWAQDRLTRTLMQFLQQRFP